ncbi:VOC family protein [Acuticoccus sediminis]|uniref:VOC family protein n=1 Tax=Acuticoccus sediminis TaxID=2184697 RepID=UPI001CFF00C9|nr:hypothetical protein [Acuticoccus sediminis]
MILKTYTRILTTDLDATLPLVRALHGIEPHLHVKFADWTLVGIGDVLIVAGTGESLAPISGSLGPWIVEDLTEVRATLADSGAEIVRDIEDVPTGRMMYARNPDGVLVEYVEWNADLLERYIWAPLRDGIPASQVR